MITVLVTGVSGFASQNVVRCAKMAGHRVIGTDVDPFAAGLYRSDKGYVVPQPWPEYVAELGRICEKEKVDVLIPGSDVELPILSKNRDRFEEMGLCMLIGSHESIMTARDKFRTQEFLRANKFPYIRSYLPDDLNRCIEEVGFPLVIKPRSAYGGTHFYLARSAEEARVLVSYTRREGWEPVLQEYVETPAEYTTGVQIAKDGTVMGSVCAWRRLKKGISANVIVDRFPEIRQSIERVAASMNTRGPLNFQSKFKNDRSLIFEINARFSGTTSIRAMAGVNEVDLLIRNFLYGETTKCEPKKLVATAYSEYLFLTEQEYCEASSEKQTAKRGTINESWW